MKTGFGYLTPAGVKFTREHPYQLVTEQEAEILLEEGRFSPASPQDLKDYYKVDEKSLLEI